MKHICIIAVLLMVAACNSSNSNNVELAKKSVLDSVHNASQLQAMKQKTIDSVNPVNEYHHALSTAVAGSQNNTVNQPTPVEKKKKMSDTTKGALIGTGVGVITGVVAGAIINKEDPAKGSAIGGAIGGAVGSGAGYGVGASKDKKEKTKATTKE